MRGCTQLVFAVATSLVWCNATVLEARSIIVPTVGPRELIRQQALTPAMFAGRKTLTAVTMGDLARMVAPVAKDAPLRYANFGDYWLRANQTNQRSGKMFEPVLTARANQQLVKMGSPNRIFPTAAEGFPTHPADLVLIGPINEILAVYQAKFRMGLKKASKVLADPKYAGMSIVTTRESFSRVLRELSKEEFKATRRGLPLALEWKLVREGLDEGRLTSNWFGKTLPPARGVNRWAARESEKMFNQRVSELAHRALIQSDLAELPSRSPRPWSWTGRTLQKTIYLGDLAMTGYLQYQDIDRFQRGEISSDYLTIKTGLRGTQIALATYTLVNPEPFSKAAGIAIVITLVVVDVGTDYVYEQIYERRAIAVRNLLASIDRNERYHAARCTLLSGL